MYYKLNAKQDKKTEVKRSVMCDMRRLGSLFFHFKDAGQKNELTVKDMLTRTNFPALSTAIQQATTEESSGIKAGLKISLYYLLQKLAKFVKIKHLINEDDASAAEVEKFEQVLKLNYNFLFGDAIYNINKNRETKLRKPEQLPPDADITLMRQYTLARFDALLKDPYQHWSSSEFIQLRNLADSRLTLFNARRGGEPARLTMANWHDARQDAWVSRDRIVNRSDEDQRLFDNMKVMYQTGKGNHLVPFLVPADTAPALDKLCDPQIRLDCGILSSNEYLFPTVRSNEHVFGLHAVNVVARNAGVSKSRPDLMTAVRICILTK